MSEQPGVPGIVDGDRVTADADRLRATGRQWGSVAQNYSTMNLRLATTGAKLPPGKLTGRRGEDARSFLAGLRTATGELAGAYARIGALAPRVADAVDDAKRAQRTRDDTRRAADAARRELDAAEDAVRAAAAAVAATTALDHMGLGGGASASAHRALEQARQRAERARTDAETKDRAARKARTAFEHAERDRTRISDRFADLVHDQIAVIRKAIPAAPTAPNVPPLVDQLGVLSNGSTALTTLLGGQLNLGRELIDPSLLRVGRRGLYRLPSSVKVFRPGELETLRTLQKWSSRLDKAGKVGGVAFPLATSAIEAFANPKLTAQQRQDYIVNRVLLEGGLGTAAGAACAPAGGIASAACGAAGSEAGKLLEKSRFARRITDGISHNTVTPYVEVGDDLVKLRLGEAFKDGVLIGPRVAKNWGGTAVDTIRHPGKIKDAADDLVSDVKGAGRAIDKAFSGPKATTWAGPGGPDDPTYAASA